MEDCKTFFSVIVPVYNVEKYLHRCLDSILAQTYPYFELLLIDDGSKDASGAICDEYAAKDNRIRVFHQENGGVSAARNKGIDEAVGEYAVFVDSDDYLKPMKLSNLSACAKEHPHFIQNYNVANDIFGNAIQDNNLAVYEWAKKVCIIWNSAFSLSLLNEHHIRFCEEFSHGEDTLFILDALSYASTVIFYQGWDYVYEEGHEGGLNLTFQSFEKEFLVLDRIAKARKRYYTLRNLDMQRGMFIYMGEILRIIKSLYLDAKKRNLWERLQKLKDVSRKMSAQGQTSSLPCKSDIVISFLYSHKMYVLLDMFMKVWLKRNRK